MTVSLKDVNETLLPRRYQEEIFTRAQQSNVIAALDTGSGKTYISTLLIKWMATRNTGDGKIIVFLVPKVALVEQQGQFIANQTPLRVSKCYGATAIDLSDREAWKAEIEGHDVLVMTGMCHTHFRHRVTLIKLHSSNIPQYNHTFSLESGQGKLVYPEDTSPRYRTVKRHDAGFVSHPFCLLSVHNWYYMFIERLNAWTRIPFRNEDIVSSSKSLIRIPSIC